MERFDIFDLNNTEADSRRDAIASAAGQLVRQGGEMIDIWTPINGTVRFEFHSPWDEGVAVDLKGFYPTSGNGVHQPRISLIIKKVIGQPRYSSPYPELQYGLHIAQTFDDDLMPFSTAVAPILSTGLIRRRQQRQSASQMADRLVRDFPATDTSWSFWQPPSIGDSKVGAIN